MVNYKTQGKKNREAGQRFELKVKIDLESKGWVIDRWTNNVELPTTIISADSKDLVRIENKGKLVTATPKTLFINGRRVIINMWTGFPDFIAFTKEKEWKCYVDEFGEEWKVEYTNKKLKENQMAFQCVIGIECKSNGYLTKEEKEKCRWLLDNKVFLKILIAKKGKKRGEIEYNEFNQKS